MRKKIKLSVKQILKKQPQNNKHKCNHQLIVKGMIVKSRKVSDTSSASTTHVNSKKCTPQNTNRNHPLRINYSLEKITDSKQPVRQRSLSAPKKTIKNNYEVNQNITNMISNRIMFINQFQTTIKELNHTKHQHIRYKQCFLSQQELFIILTTMNYINEDSNKLVKKIYRQLGGLAYGGIASQNLKQFLIVVNGNNEKKVKVKQSYHRYEKDQKFIDYNLKFKASEKQKKYIFISYAALRNNRKNKQIQINSKQNKNINIFDKIKEIQSTQPNSLQEEHDKVLPTQKIIQPKTQLYEDSFENLFLKEKGIIYEQQKAVLTQKAILSVDVNLGEGLVEKIIVYQGQSPSNVADRLSKNFQIDQTMKIKFQKMLQSHIRCLLWKIEEVSEELFSDRQ